VHSGLLTQGSPLLNTLQLRSTEAYYENFTKNISQLFLFYIPAISSSQWPNLVGGSERLMWPFRGVQSERQEKEYFKLK
jgi:hypothetical protein